MALPPGAALPHESKSVDFVETLEFYAAGAAPGGVVVTEAAVGAFLSGVREESVAAAGGSAGGDLGAAAGAMDVDVVSDGGACVDCGLVACVCVCGVCGAWRAGGACQCAAVGPGVARSAGLSGAGRG